jgi:hypothetical protein
VVGVLIISILVDLVLVVDYVLQLGETLQLIDN